MNPTLCRAQGEGFCLKEHNQERHEAYVAGRRAKKKKTD